MKASIRWTSINLFALALSALITACIPTGESLEGDVSFLTNTLLTPTSTIKPTEPPLTIPPTATTLSMPTASPIESAARPTSSLLEDNESNLYQVSSIPDSTISWTSENVLKVHVDSVWNGETRCTIHSWQEFSVRQHENSIEIVPISTSETVRCPEQKPSLPDALTSTLPGVVVDQIESSEGTNSLLFIEVSTSNLPMIGNAVDIYSEDDLPLLEGWVIDHETTVLQPVFATQLNYVYRFLPGNRNIAIQQDCYGDNLGGGLHIVNIEDSSILTLAETYSGLCEGIVGMMPSPSGEYLIYDKGTIVNVDGNIVGKLCTEEQHPRSWTWSFDSKQVYVACSEDEYDLIWQYGIETGNKVLLNDLINPTVSIKARQMAVSPDEKWLVFVWGTSDLYSLDEYGVWVLKLEQGIW